MSQSHVVPRLTHVVPAKVSSQNMRLIPVGRAYYAVLRLWTLIHFWDATMYVVPSGSSNGVMEEQFNLNMTPMTRGALEHLLTWIDTHNFEIAAKRRLDTSKKSGTDTYFILRLEELRTRAAPPTSTFVLVPDCIDTVYPVDTIPMVMPQNKWLEKCLTDAVTVPFPRVLDRRYRFLLGGRSTVRVPARDSGGAALMAASFFGRSKCDALGVHPVMVDTFFSDTNTAPPRDIMGEHHVGRWTPRSLMPPTEEELMALAAAAEAQDRAQEREEAAAEKKRLQRKKKRNNRRQRRKGDVLRIVPNLAETMEPLTAVPQPAHRAAPVPEAAPVPVPAPKVKPKAKVKPKPQVPAAMPKSWVNAAPVSRPNVISRQNWPALPQHVPHVPAPRPAMARPAVKVKVVARPAVQVRAVVPVPQPVPVLLAALPLQVRAVVPVPKMVRSVMPVVRRVNEPLPEAPYLPGMAHYDSMGNELEEGAVEEPVACPVELEEGFQNDSDSSDGPD